MATFEKGEDIVLKIPFTGNPKPTAKWLRDGEEIKPSSKFRMETGDRHAILTIKGVEKSDDGPYRLTLENTLGTDSAPIKIQINGTRHLDDNIESLDFIHSCMKMLKFCHEKAIDS